MSKVSLPHPRAPLHKMGAGRYAPMCGLPHTRWVPAGMHSCVDCHIQDGCWQVCTHVWTAMVWDRACWCFLELHRPKTGLDLNCHPKSLSLHALEYHLLMGNV